MRPDEVYAILKGKIVKLSEKVDGIPTPLTYKGSVDAVENLPANPGIGWMYNISQKSIYGEAGINVAWTGTEWDSLGPIIDMSTYLTKEDAGKTYQTKGNYLESVPQATESSVGGITAKAKTTESMEAAVDPETGRMYVPDNHTPVDEGLKNPGEAADAKATGDAIAPHEIWYEGVDLTVKFADEIAQYSDAWQWIRARIKAGNFSGIHVADYIPWTSTDGKVVKSCVLGINTYKRYGDSEVPNHIDFISKDLWPVLHVMNPVNFNNGVIPIETLSGDGATTEFVLANEMAAISSITVDGTAVTDYTYDVDTHTVTFASAPAASTNNITVTGKGSEYPWLSCDLYLYLNSLKGHVPNGTGTNPRVKLVDYTNDGVWSKMPEALKNVIVTKRVLLPKRYSASGVLSSDNSWGWENAGKLWIPSEMEVYGTAVWGNSGYGTGGFVQYPYFKCNMRRVKGLGDGGGRGNWRLLSASAGSTSSFAYVSYAGLAYSTIASYAWIGEPVCFRIS